MQKEKENINIVNYKVSDLIFAEYNPRELTKDQHQDLKDSITRFGFVDPLIVNTHKERKNILVGGHQRLKIAKELSYSEVPCVEIELTPDKEKELNVRLNKNTGQWDWDSLANYFDAGKLLEWGFTEDELQFTEPEVQGLTDDDDLPEVEEAITQQGDLWILGEHRLLCGDATKKEDVERLMDGEKANMVFTDPPYNANYNPDNAPRASSRSDKSKINKRKLGNIKNDFMTSKDYRIFLLSVYENMIDILEEGSVFYLCCNYPSVVDYSIILENMNVNLSGCIVWDKGALILDRKDYHASHELIIYGWKKGAAHQFTDDKSLKDTWLIKRDSFKDYKHPTQKPIELVVNAIKNHNYINVYDAFLGSGSTLIACEKLKRKCYGMELDPHYCDVIVKRWEDYSGNKAERIEAANA
tara:strand:+ start:449 stop:1687 length:1239 start_codon:yes stop_codon:yes gene_type:complete